MKKRIYFILAIVASVMIASCTSDEYLGNNSEKSSNDAITFGSGFKAVTRGESTGADAAAKLNNEFKIYGVKQDKTTTTNYNKVFVDYTVKYNEAQAGKADYNDGWYYVGAETNQYIKYWDYSSACYHFVAGSPVANFTYTVDGTTGDIKTATITGLGGHLTANPTDGSGTALSATPIYIADPVNVSKANFNQEVQFTFTCQQSFVRVGVYTTLSGYSISDIKFYSYDESSDAWASTKSSNITLASKTAGYFSGATTATATVTYDWTGANPTYTYAYTSDLTSAKNWYGGLLAGVQATSSTEATIAKLYGTDKDMASSTGYFPVIPMASATDAAPILVKCDYELSSLDGSGEIINVSGATAAIPAAFSKWAPNTSYTYLFKISQNTNGSTGPDGPEGLFPITFDAVVKTEEDGTAQGIITTVSTPSITTYQEGSVTAEGIKYKYNATTPSDTKPIYFTVQNDESGALYTLTDGGSAVGAVQVYKLNGAKTEADLQVSAPTGTDMFTLGTVAATVGKFSFEANKYGYFTPTAAGYYAIQYLTKAASSTDPAAYTYKIVYVE